MRRGFCLELMTETSALKARMRLTAAVEASPSSSASGADDETDYHVASWPRETASESDSTSAPVHDASLR